MIKRSNGFTLIELITVIAVIVILLGFLIGSSASARKRAKINQAKSEIAALETALNAYRADIGTFPVDGSGSTVNADVVRQLGGLDLSGAKISGLSEDWNGPYLEFDKVRLSPSGGEFLDPWNNAYQIRGLGDDAGTTEADLHNKYTFDILSYGPDSTDDEGASGSDDIANF